MSAAEQNIKLLSREGSNPTDQLDLIITINTKLACHYELTREKPTDHNLISPPLADPRELARAPRWATQVHKWSARPLWDLARPSSSAPRFASEPAGLVEYSNSTGAVLTCRPQLEQPVSPSSQRLASATATYVSWYLVHQLPGDQAPERPASEPDEDEAIEDEQLLGSSQDHQAHLRARYLRPDGALAIAPFAPGAFRREIHAATYRCCLTNRFGRLCSRPVRTQAGKLPAPWCRSLLEQAPVF